ncbi:MAG: YfcE family phosphodiesterase [Chloroflexi bacterium]|nr:YfcE family phosphodiesterase [Chloroflexota bacterium]
MIPVDRRLDLSLPARIGVVSDTHVPDRNRVLHPGVIPCLQSQGVQVILHAGDISSPEVLDELNRVAPVIAVRGNRDRLRRSRLPEAYDLKIAGISIGLAHGDGGWMRYIGDKLRWVRYGYQLERYTIPLLELFPHARVIVFGHTHRPLNEWVGGVLLFNPGAAAEFVSPVENLAPSLGILTLVSNSVVDSKIVPIRTV